MQSFPFSGKNEGFLFIQSLMQNDEVPLKYSFEYFNFLCWATSNHYNYTPLCLSLPLKVLSIVVVLKTIKGLFDSADYKLDDRHHN